MTSEDVLHDFFVPDMRVKHDIVPGRYTEVWFTPTVLGLHHVTCAEYCGKGHSDMQAKLTVDNEADFKKLHAKPAARSGKIIRPSPPIGARCSGSARAAPPATRSTERKTAQAAQLEGHLGQDGKDERRQEVLVDEAYVSESMMQPQAKIVAGFEPIMPTFQGLLREHGYSGA